MNRQEHNTGWEAGLRQRLTDEQMVRVQEAFRSGANPQWEDDLNLNALLRRLPDRPVPSNFTQLVLEAVSREPQARSGRRISWRYWLLKSWLPKPALASVLLGGSLLGYFQYQSYARIQMAESVAQISQAAEWVGLSALMDFDAINRLDQANVPVDEQLLAVLQ